MTLSGGLPRGSPTAGPAVGHFWRTPSRPGRSRAETRDLDAGLEQGVPPSRRLERFVGSPVPDPGVELLEPTEGVTRRVRVDEGP